MFDDMLAGLEQGRWPDLDILVRRFDVAMTKKLGVVRLPPAFWMSDPKINPDTDHLVWASFVLGDRKRCDLALSALAVEEQACKGTDFDMGDILYRLLSRLLCLVADQSLKQRLRANVLCMYPDRNDFLQLADRIGSCSGNGQSPSDGENIEP
ncbi:hypothetical protein [Desulfolithobacter sp.]